MPSFSFNTYLEHWYFFRGTKKHETIINCEHEVKGSVPERQGNITRFRRINFRIGHRSNERNGINNENEVSSGGYSWGDRFHHILLSLVEPPYLMHEVERNFTEARLSELIELALSDKVSFTSIRNEFGLREIEVKNLMRKNLKPKSYAAWRKRIFRKAK